MEVIAMYINIYENLPIEAKIIREAVFIIEQGFLNEFDDIDSYAKHLVLFHMEIPIATCRFFRKELSEEYFIGRIAVIKEYRGKNIGAYLLKTAEKEVKKLGDKKIFLHAQCKAEKFYKKQSYNSYGEIDFEENCSHIWMCKKIKKDI